MFEIGAAYKVVIAKTLGFIREPDGQTVLFPQGTIMTCINVQGHKDSPSKKWLFMVDNQVVYRHDGTMIKDWLKKVI